MPQISKNGIDKTQFTFYNTTKIYGGEYLFMIPVKPISKSILIRISEAVFAYLIAGVFLIAVISKLLNPQQFLQIMQKSFSIKPFYLKIFAVTIINFEMLVILMLIIPKFRTKGAILATLILLIFTIFKCYHFIHRTNANCGCFIGIYEQSISIKGIAINVILTIISCALLWASIAQRNLKAWH